MGDAAQKEVLMRFFKTGKGEYGEGDIFLGIRVPQTRALVKNIRHKVAFSEIETLLYSQQHEVRLCALLLLAEEMTAASAKRSASLSHQAMRRREIVEFYLTHARQANNWDLVDLSAPKILGTYILLPDTDGKPVDSSILDRLAASTNLWEQRIAIVSTLALIQNGRLDETFRIADKLFRHSHDLIHKATGWMLREAGKRDVTRLTAYLRRNYRAMSRTTLRYAIERMPESERKYWLKA